MAGDFPCSGIRLHRRVPLGELGGVAGNDIWGWTDSLTGAEYALMGMTNGTAFVNVSDPENPIVLGRLPTQTVASVWRDIKVYRDHAYIVADRAGRHGLQVFDLTRLRNAIPPQLFTPDLVYGDFGSAHNLAINEATGFAYVVGSGDAFGAHLPAARVRPPGMVHGRPPLFPAGR
jgi:choice-of-anchor B domain-containing protein